MDLTWLALTVGVLAILVVAILARSMLQELVEPRRIEKVPGCIEHADAGDIKERCFKSSIEFLTYSVCPRVFIGS